MRAILIDWMSLFCFENRLKRDTLHKAIYYVDRFLLLTHDVG
jgi:hypothetical protein